MTRSSLGPGCGWTTPTGSDDYRAGLQAAPWRALGVCLIERVSLFR